MVYVKVLYLAILMEKLKKTMKRLEQLVARPSFEPGTSRMQASRVNVAPFCLRKKESDLGVLEAISLSYSWMSVSF